MQAGKWESLNPRDASVMVVEDNPDDLRMIARAIQNFGVERIFAVNTGEQAVAQLEEQACDVVLTDYGLPGMNGLRVVELAVQARPQPQVIMMTGMGDVRTAVTAMKLGACDYIAKDEMLTSGLVNSLQSALRTSIEARTSAMERAVEAGDRLEIAEAEADWLILYDIEGHGYGKPGPIQINGDDEEVGHVREMLCRYLELRELGFQAPTQKEEEGIVAAFVTRGMSSQAMLALYRASIQSMRARNRLDGRQLAVNPTASFVRVLSRVIEEYQCQLSMAALATPEVA